MAAATTFSVLPPAATILSLKEELHTCILNNNNLATPNLELDTRGSGKEEAVTQAAGQAGQAEGRAAESLGAWYAGARVFVTGGTGFVGKALLEKLVRACPGVAAVYVLVRPKRGLTHHQRFKDLLNSPVFERVRAACPERLGKLVAVCGDVSCARLGLSAPDLQLLQQCTVVLHSAATVRFTEPLSQALTLNVLGTRRLLELAAGMPHLRALVHVSTAYSNAPQSHVLEQVYAPPLEPHTLIRCAEGLPPHTLDALAPLLQGSHPNTYTLTKALAESIVHQYSAKLPVCIVRPSIVTAAHEEPYPGWIDNVCGVTGIVMEIGRGTYRSGYCREQLVVDLVPVDIVVNACLVAAWACHDPRAGAEQCSVYNVTSGGCNPLPWGEFTRYCVKHARDNPTKYTMMYPNFAFTECRLLNTFWETVTHLLPACLYDLVLRAQGRKPIMMKVARRFQLAAATGEYFANHEWRFACGRYRALQHALEHACSDAHAFSLDVSAVRWDPYVRAYMLGIRQYILHDSLDSLPSARQRLRRLYWLWRLLQAASGYCLLRILSKRIR